MYVSSELAHVQENDDGGIYIAAICDNDVAKSSLHSTFCTAQGLCCTNRLLPLRERQSGKLFLQ